MLLGMEPITVMASVLDDLQDVSAIVIALLAFGLIFLLLEGLDRV